MTSRRRTFTLPRPVLLRTLSAHWMQPEQEAEGGKTGSSGLSPSVLPIFHRAPGRTYPCCKALPFPPFYTGRNGGRSVRSYLRISIQWQPRDSNPQPGEAVSCQAGTRPPPGPSGWFRFRLAAPCDVASAGWCPVRGEGAWEDCSPGPAGLPACASMYPQMPCRCYNPDQVSVCQINGKTYWTGTIMQTNEITAASSMPVSA